MADVNVPIRFEIYKGDQPVREEILAQDVIKIGKLASSHLRLDDETVSRMHAVIETTGPNEIHVVDLGSTRGTTVNGERITKARLQSGDEIMFGDCRVVVTFMEGAGVQETPPPQAAWGGRPAGGFAPPPTAAYAPPPQQALRAAAAGLRAAAGTVGRLPASRPAYQQQAYAPPPSFAGAPGAGAEVEVHDGSRAMEVQTVFRGVVTGTRLLFNPEGKSTHGQGTSMLYAGVLAFVVALATFIFVAIDVGAEKVRVRGLAERRQGLEVLLLEGPFAGVPGDCLRRPRRRHRAVVHGAQAARQGDRELRDRLGRRRRRAGLA